MSYQDTVNGEAVTGVIDSAKERLNHIFSIQPVAPSWDFEVDGYRYRMVVAATRSDRQEAYSLVHRIYAAQGFTEDEGLWYSIHNALPGTVTLLVRNADGQAVASGTVIPDSPLGLPMERMYSEELDGLRRAGRRICEINSLVSTVTGEGWRTHTVILKVFSAAYAYVRNVMGWDDLVCVASPEHARFYSHVLMLDQLGGLKKDPHANGADSIALRLDATTAEERFQTRYGRRQSTRNLFSFFRPSEDEISRFTEWLAASMIPLGEETFRYFFVDREDLVTNLRIDELKWIRDAYPGFDLWQLPREVKGQADECGVAVA